MRATRLASSIWSPGWQVTENAVRRLLLLRWLGLSRPAGPALQHLLEPHLTEQAPVAGVLGDAGLAQGVAEHLHGGLMPAAFPGRFRS